MSFSESTPFIWLQFTPKATVYFTICLEHLLSILRLYEWVRHPESIVAQYNTTTRVRYPFGYNTALKIVYFSIMS